MLKCSRFWISSRKYNSNIWLVWDSTFLPCVFHQQAIKRNTFYWWYTNKITHVFFLVPFSSGCLVNEMNFLGNGAQIGVLIDACRKSGFLSCSSTSTYPICFFFFIFGQKKQIFAIFLEVNENFHLLISTIRQISSV